MITAQLRRLAARLTVMVADGSTDSSEVAGRTTLVVASGTVAFLSLGWVATYLVLQRPVAALIPFAYQVATLIGLVVVSRGRGFSGFRRSQVGLMTILPFILQWTLGGYSASSAVSLWALVAALGAVFFLGASAAAPWFMAFVGLTIASAVLDPVVRAGSQALPDAVRTAFFALNVLGVAVTSFVMLQAFVRQREAALAALDAEHARSERLLLNVLPGPMAERLKAGAGTIADSHPAVTVLFADVVGFTQYAERVGPADVVTTLDRLFTAFDEIADRHGVDKIKTIGDAYLLVGGLPEARPDHVAAVARAALDLIDASARLASESGTGLQIRIGMDTGAVVAGVIGTRKFSYDLWGDTVNTAARLESSGVAGRIHVSSRVATGLRDAYEFERRGVIELKGKGPVETFFLVGHERA